MDTLAIGIDERLEAHRTGPGFPERPERLHAVRAGLEASGVLDACPRVEAAAAERSAIERVHLPEHIDRIEQACRAGARTIDDPDVPVCPESFEAALLAAGICLGAARMIGRGEVRRSFCAVRPPGHHAERNRAMGFCLFNNVALCASALRSEFGFERVAIVDWDVHHGNGTQHSFEDDPQVLFISLHEDPDHQYPGTGYAHEVGIDAGRGATVNLPFQPGSGDEAYRAAFSERVVPKLEGFAPQAVLISAGFDAHADDPLGHLHLSDEVFVWMLEQLVGVAERFAEGRVLSVLEGGYDAGVLTRCVRDHVLGLQAD